jgi:hypothetical protein
LAQEAAFFSTVAPTGVRAPLGVIMSAMRAERVTVRLSAGELTRVDEFRGSRSRSAYVRELIRSAAPPDDPEPDHGEAIQLLAQSARDGSVTARVHLERALRGDRRKLPSDSELERLLRGDG